MLRVNLASFQKPWVEVVVVVDEPQSKDRVLDTIQRLPEVKWRVICHPWPHEWRPPSRAINAGVRKALAPTVVICSPESAFVGDALEVLVSEVERRESWAAIGWIQWGSLQ